MPGGRPRSPSADADPCVPAGFACCPVDAAFTVLGRKWSILILRNLIRGDRRFSELIEHIDGLTPKVLSLRLKELERERLVRKRVTASSPIRIEYGLTDKGLAILPILRSMAAWSVQWSPERVLSNGRRPVDLEAILREWEAGLVRVQAEPPALRRAPRRPADA